VIFVRQQLKNVLEILIISKALLFENLEWQINRNPLVTEGESIFICGFKSPPLMHVSTNRLTCTCCATLGLLKPYFLSSECDRIILGTMYKLSDLC
jgi:hypothetical protein